MARPFAQSATDPIIAEMCDRSQVQKVLKLAGTALLLLWAAMAAPAVLANGRPQVQASATTLQGHSI